MMANTNTNGYGALCEFARGAGCEVFENAPLAERTTFRIGGECAALVTPKTETALSDVLKYLKANALPYTVLGNGSNVIAPDEFYNKAVIRISDGLTQLKLIDSTTVFCGAGVKLTALCRFALENSLSGLEFAYGIPGSCGGAAFMNAGAYGGEMNDVIVKIHHITPDGERGELTNEQAALGYRTSAYKSNDCIITGIEVKLTKGNPDEIRGKMEELMKRRKDKQPLEYPSAGSTFKRPEGYFAGALIEQCGLKGKAVGGAAVSEKHAGFVVNIGGATAADVKALIALVQDTVKKETGVTLEPEVIFLR